MLSVGYAKIYFLHFYFILGFVIVAACVMTFEARDSASKVVPARFRKPHLESDEPIKEKTKQPVKKVVTKMDKSVGPNFIPVVKDVRKIENRQELINAYLQFSNKIQDYLDHICDKGSKYKLNPVIHKSPSAPCLNHQFRTKKPKLNVFQTLSSNVIASNKPSKRKKSLVPLQKPFNNLLIPSTSVEYSDENGGYPVEPVPMYSPVRGDLCDKFSANTVHEHLEDPEDYPAPFALELHNQEGPVTLKIEDESKQIRNLEDDESSSESLTATPLLSQHTQTTYAIPPHLSALSSTSARPKEVDFMKSVSVDSGQDTAETLNTEDEDSEITSLIDMTRPKVKLKKVRSSPVVRLD